jgi:crossover junction endodeoxyribonuclease RusA
MGKRRFIGAKGKEFRRVVLEVSEGVQKTEGRLSMRVELYPPDRRVRDIDNITKALLDACMHAGATTMTARSMNSTSSDGKFARVEAAR